MGESLEVNARCRIDQDELEWRFAPSGGPGGQHANKASTRAGVRFDVTASPSLDEYQRARLLARIGPVVRISVDEERSQLRNRRLALERLRERLAAALVEPRTRRKTRPTRGSVERRLDAKRRQSTRKRQRRPDLE